MKPPAHARKAADLARRAAALVVLVLVTGCDSARRGEPAAAPIGPMSEEAQRGERVFMRECNLCHPGGQGGLGPAINNKPLPESLFRLQVRKGLGAMPAFSKDQISDAELDAIVAYWKVLHHAPGPED